MERRNREVLKKTYKQVCVLLIMLCHCISCSYVWFTRMNRLHGVWFEGKGNILMIGFYVVMQYFLIRAYGGFKIGYNKPVNVVLSQIVALLFGDLVFVVQITLMVGDMYHFADIGRYILRLMLLNVFAAVVLTNILIVVYDKLFPPYDMLLINGNYDNHLERKISTRKDKYIIKEEISAEKDTEILEKKMQEYDAVLFNDIPTELRNELLKFCFSNSIRAYFTPKISDILVKGTDEVDLFDSPLFLSKNIGLSIGQRFCKRFMDILIAALVLAITSPILLVVAVLIKSHDGGPVLYTQKRVTLNGRVFTMYKLRSMIVDAEADGKAHPAVDDDMRITPVGRFIRATRIDELPQLVNILKGDMSFVGPRPERVEHVEKYTREVPEFSYRLKVKGGLTGYAQVYGKYNTSAYDKLKMDLKYIVNYSLILDIQIILMTLKVIFVKESTEGFEQKEDSNTWNSGKSQQ